jgi:hypothetical protein
VVLEVEVIDLASNAAIAAATDRSDGSEEALLASVDRVAGSVLNQLQHSESRARAAAVPRPTLSPPEPQALRQPVPKAETGRVPTALIISGFGLFGTAFIVQEIATMANSMSNSDSRTASMVLYALIPIGGPIVAQQVAPQSSTAMTLAWLDAGAQLLGAAAGIIGVVWASNPAPDGDVVAFDARLGPRSVALAGRF